MKNEWKFQEYTKEIQLEILQFSNNVMQMKVKVKMMLSLNGYFLPRSTKPYTSFPVHHSESSFHSTRYHFLQLGKHSQIKKETDVQNENVFTSLWIYVQARVTVFLPC
jgi:hypothetical protein